jgi:hypothetical protein
MNKNELYLIYINEIGKDYKSDNLYEFIFSDTCENIDGEEWDEYPAAGKPEPPNINYIHYVGKLKTEYKFDVIQDSDTFSVWDAVDGLVALAWENIDDYDEYPETRIYFRFGETMKEVESKLYEKEIKLDYITIQEHEKA